MPHFAQVLLSIAVLVSFESQAQIRAEHVAYKDGNTSLKGYLVYDSKSAAKRPGIVVVHAWKGLDPFVMKKAEELARLGYTAFAADIYGQDNQPKDAKEAATTSSRFKKDRPLLRRRVQLAVNELRKHKTVNKQKLAAMGYCFGGTAVLELARSGSDVLGVVSFHGGLDSEGKQKEKIKAKVLALHGADDPFVPEKDVKHFEDEMRQAKVDWQLVKYSGAVHSFTNPEAGSDPAKGSAYNKAADRRSWEAMRDFFAELFK